MTREQLIKRAVYSASPRGRAIRRIVNRLLKGDLAKPKRQEMSMNIDIKLLVIEKAGAILVVNILSLIKFKRAGTSGSLEAFGCEIFSYKIK